MSVSFGAELNGPDESQSELRMTARRSQRKSEVNEAGGIRPNSRSFLPSARSNYLDGGLRRVSAGDCRRQGYLAGDGDAPPTHGGHSECTEQYESFLSPRFSLCPLYLATHWVAGANEAKLCLFSRGF